uniref:Uncharacterized protein n=1 Tax=Romanomermis culicivorax TaxID=13658 RepID=A0A915K5F8_ROMCU
MKRLSVPNLFDAKFEKRRNGSPNSLTVGAGMGVIRDKNVSFVSMDLPPDNSSKSPRSNLNFNGSGSTENSKSCNFMQASFKSKPTHSASCSSKKCKSSKFSSLSRTLIQSAKLSNKLYNEDMKIERRAADNERESDRPKYWPNTDVCNVRAIGGRRFAGRAKCPNCAKCVAPSPKSGYPKYLVWSTETAIKDCLGFDTKR